MYRVLTNQSGKNSLMNCLKTLTVKDKSLDRLWITYSTFLYIGLLESVLSLVRTGIRPDPFGFWAKDFLNWAVPYCTCWTRLITSFTWNKSLLNVNDSKIHFRGSFKHILARSAFVYMHQPLNVDRFEMIDMVHEYVSLFNLYPGSPSCPLHPVCAVFIPKHQLV